MAGRAVVIAATDDDAANRAVAVAAKSRSIPHVRSSRSGWPASFNAVSALTSSPADAASDWVTFVVAGSRAKAWNAATEASALGGPLSYRGFA